MSKLKDEIVNLGVANPAGSVAYLSDVCRLVFY